MPAPRAEIPPAPPAPLERRVFDYGGLETAMAQADHTIRNARRTLDARAAGTMLTDGQASE